MLRRGGGLLWTLLLGAQLACASATVDPPDAGRPDTGRPNDPPDAGPPDGGAPADAAASHVLRDLNLAPGLGASNNDGHRLRGGLRAGSGMAESDKHRLRGRLAPIGQ